MAREFHLEIDDSINEVFDEGVGSSFLAMRKLRWSPNSEYKIDLRKWFTNSEGEEIAGKGFSFITESGPSNLINALMKHGYGDTREILNNMKDRDDFLYNVEEVLTNMGSELGQLIAVKPVSVESEDASFFDPKEMFG